MSKIQSSIQKAIEKSRDIKSSQHSNANQTIQRKRGAATNSGNYDHFRNFKLTHAQDDAMEQNRIVSAIDDKAAKSAYNLLRTRVLQRMRANNWRMLLVTSPGPGDGKTLTATNLAISVSRNVDQPVFLVDLDLQRSSISKYWGIDIDVKMGIGDFLQGKADLEDIIYSPDNMQRLALIMNREPVPNSSDILASPRMKELVSWLRQRSNESLILFDMPPVLACDDVLAFCPEVDAILLVVAEGVTDRQALDKTMELLAERELLGVVLNMSSELSGKDSYYYY